VTLTKIVRLVEITDQQAQIGSAGPDRWTGSCYAQAERMVQHGVSAACHGSAGPARVSRTRSDQIRSDHCVSAPRHGSTGSVWTSMVRSDHIGSLSRAKPRVETSIWLAALRHECSAASLSSRHASSPSSTHNLSPLIQDQMHGGHSSHTSTRLA
jgi:hypothetical protein